MQPSHKRTGGNAVFYRPVGVVAVIRSGYLHKSPPPKPLNAEKSWKRRYFMLFKISENEHQLKYFRSAEETDRPLGGIDLTHVSLLHVSPEQHQKWGWIQKNFKCSSSCVLHVRADSRDYFLLGESSDEVDGWFSDLFDALKHRPHRCRMSEPAYKTRSISDPSPNALENYTKLNKDEEHSKRPISDPGNPIYDYPIPNWRLKEIKGDGLPCGKSDESPYEIMRNCTHDEPETQPVDREAGTLMRSVPQTFDRLKTWLPPPPSIHEETNAEDREEMRAPDSSGSSSDSGTISPVGMLERRRVPPLEKLNSTESIDHVIPEERDIEVKRADLKKHLTLADVDGKPCVSGWTGQPGTVCLFHKGDHILGINDLHISNLKEFNMYVSKSLKDEVKLTILRLPGCVPLHPPNGLCSDEQETGP